jgi:hypothetical protein
MNFRNLALSLFRQTQFHYGLELQQKRRPQ